MGKIRTKIIGSDEEEKKQKKEAKARREAKKASKETASAVVAPEILAQKSEPIVEEKPKKAKKNVVKSRSRGKRHLLAQKLVDKNKQYSVSEAVAILKKMPAAKFDQTVELHLNLLEKGLKGQVTLPHGSGKTIRVAIVDDAVIALIEKGKIDFDVLIARPVDMPKLVAFAKVLGPKGLMPNPKNGTVSAEPEKAAEKFQGGGIQFKSESKFPLLHQAIGKMSFENKQIEENISAFVESVAKKNIKSLYLKSTMSPSIAISLD